MPTPETLLLVALILAATYAVFGMTGFGSTVLALPVLAHFMALKFAVPLLMLLDLAAGLTLVGSARSGVRKDEMWRLVPFLLAGLVLGVFLLVGLPERPLLTALGVFLLAYAGYGLTRRGELSLSALWAAPFGLAGGIFAALFGTGGVLVSLYVAGRLKEKSELRATVAAAVLVNSATRLVLFGAVGLLTADVLLSALWLLPSLVIGLRVGQRLHAVVPANAVLKALYVLVLLAGVSLLARYAA
jgi:uncharacterized membrane protein YfcA